jgi:hypothetical protein
MTRFNIINQIIKKHNYQKYLEIGTQNGNCFTEIDIPYKICVDIEKRFHGLTHEMSSDDFFNQNKETFDIIFVDGLHTEEQTTIDVLNSLKWLNEKGTIVMHDCLPHCEEYINQHFSGTVFRSVIDLRYDYPDLTVEVVDADCGCGIVTRGQQIVYDKVPKELAKTYYYYSNNKQELMNVITTEQFISKYNS